jgi:hypothetical protein
MPTKTQSFKTLDVPNRIAFQVELPDGTTPAFATTGKSDVEVGERYWNSYDGELYRVTRVDDKSVEVVLEFGCGEIPRDAPVDLKWLTPDGHALHHVAPQTD